MLEKLKLLLNPKKWFEGVIMTKVMGRVVKVAASGIVAWLFSDSVAPMAGKIFSQFERLFEVGAELVTRQPVDLTFSPQSIEEITIILLTACVMGLIKFIKHRFPNVKIPGL